MRCGNGTNDEPWRSPRVGVRVEDVDISHLEHLLTLSEDFDDISMIVENLSAGSRNHMRSFVGALDERDAEYEIVYIPELMDGILSSEMEIAVIYDEDGEILAECGLKARPKTPSRLQIAHEAHSASPYP